MKKFILLACMALSFMAFVQPAEAGRRDRDYYRSCDRGYYPSHRRVYIDYGPRYYYSRPVRYYRSYDYGYYEPRYYQPRRSGFSIYFSR